MTEKEAARAFRAEQRKILAERTAFMRATRDRIVALLNHALEEIKVTLAGAPTDYQQWSLPQLAREIRQTLDRFQQEAGAEISAAAGKAWASGEALVVKPLEAAGVRLTASLPMLDTRPLLAMRAFMVDRIKDIGVQAANRISNELGLVVIGTQSPSEAIGNVTRILGEPSRTRATTIVRTELGRASAVSSFEKLKQSAEKVPGTKKQWRKSNKAHPRIYHELADGQIQEVNDPFILAGGTVKLMFPHDPKAPASEVINCGCLALPYYADMTMAHPGKAPGGRFGDDPVPVDKIVGLREAYNKNQRRAPKGTHDGGKWTAGPSLPALAADAQGNPKRDATHELGAVSVGNAVAVQKAVGLRLDGFRRIVNDRYLRHTFRAHGNQATETLRGQRAVTAADFSHLPAITAKPGSVAIAGRMHRGGLVLVYEKKIGKETFVYAESVHPGTYRVAFRSLYVRTEKPE